MRELLGFKKGINFGGWFSQCDYSNYRYDNFIKEEDFKKVASWGMDHVRIPFDYNLILNDDYSFNEEGFKRLDKCAMYCVKYNLNLIFDLHKTVGFSFDSNEKEDGFFTSQKYQDIFYSIWEEVVSRYKKYGLMVAYELLNEVTDKKYKDAWNKIASEAIRRIRAISSNAKILVGGYYNNAVSAVKDINVPFDENIVLNFHCYEPLVFTHQGAYWIDKMKPDFRMSYDLTFNEVISNTKENIGNKALDYSFMRKDEKISSNYFEIIFKEAIDKANKEDCYLYCGEYGVIENAEVEDTKKWYVDIHSVLDKYHIGHALWSYKEMDFDFVNPRFDSVRSEILK